MSAVVKRNVEDLVYEAVVNNLVGGEVVIPSTTATESGLQGVVVATNAADNVLGVASKPSVTAANRAALTAGTGPAPGNYPFVDAGIPSATLTVYNNCVTTVTYDAVAIDYGDPICASANGNVREWISGTDAASAKIGWCAQPGGVSAAGGKALARILV
jgi:hypothetical protein